MGDGSNMEIAFHVILKVGTKFCLNSRGWLVKAALGNWIRSKTLKLATTLIILKDAGFLCMLKSTEVSGMSL